VSIAASLERHLNAGLGAAGEPLPTVRDLAATLHVSPATVSAANKLLRARGLVAGQGRRGTRVAPPRQAPAELRSPMVPAGTIDLATGNPDPRLLPPVAPAIRVLEDDMRLYGERRDSAGLLAFASSEFEADGVPARSLAVVSGAMDAIERILREHLRPGDAVAIEDPSFPGLIDLIAASGYEAVPFDVDEEGPRSDGLAAALRRRCAAVVVTPRAQNPTGAAVTAARACCARFPALS
jgi:DNA-binding transcriptional MocR family regulator